MIKIEHKRNFFTPVERGLIQKGERLFADGVLFNAEAMVRLSLGGIDPFSKKTRRELGRVYGYCHIDRNIGNDLTLTAGYLKMRTDHFLIYLRTLAFCLNDKEK